MKKTKIIATISSRMCDPHLLKQLHEAGMDVVRINTAHATPEDALTIVENVRAVSERIAIMIDTKGPEIRTTETAGDIHVKARDIVCVCGNPLAETTAACINVTYDRFADAMNPNDRILIDDGDIELLVLDKKTGTLTCEVQNGGVIKGRKSVNLPTVNIHDLPPLSEKDKTFITFAMDHEVDFVAHSFVRSRDDVRAVQELLDARGSQVKIIAKIENHAGVENIDGILDGAYGVMVARGDLAIEMPAEKIPIIQKQLVIKCIERRKPVIIATQMLQSMISAPRPTRAEVSDVANAILDHTDAVMLSGETANGRYPVESVKMMATIAKEVETSLTTFSDTPYESENTVTSYLAKAAVKAGMRLDAKALIADSISGKTILSLVAYRGVNPIFAQCYSRRVMRELALSFGVHASYMEPDLTTHEFLSNAVNRLLEEKHLQEDDLITVLAGNFGVDAGASYVEISTAKNLLRRK
jgi:pyruvate kinase